MKTVIVNKDNIVLGFGEAVINPEASKLIINEILLASPEAIAVAGKKDLLNAKNKLANDAYNIAKIAHNTAMQAQENEKNATSPEDKAVFTAEYKSRIAARDIKNNERKNHLALAQAIIDEELTPALKLLAVKQKLLWDSNSVEYFEPKSGECIVTDSEYEAIETQYPIPANKALQFNSVAKTGTIIDNLVGQVYWLDSAGAWTKGVIDQIGVGVPVEAIKQEDLSEVQQLAISDQFETARVAGLTVAEKDAEKAQAIANATAQSVNLRSQYEIQGSTATTALADAMVWLDAEKVIIEAKYA